MKLSPWSVFFLFSLFLGQGAFAQEGGKEKREIIIRTLTFTKMKKDKVVFIYSLPLDPEKKGQKVPLKTYLNNERFTVELLGNEVIFSRSAQPETALEEAVARVKVPKKLKRMLVVFFPAENPGGKGKEAYYRVMVIDDSTDAFPPGSLLCHNLTHQTLRLTLERKGYEFKPGSRKLITDQPVNKRNHSAMNAYAKEGSQWNRISASLWPHPGPKRVLQFFYIDPKSQQVHLKGIKDISIE